MVIMSTEIPSILKLLMEQLGQPGGIVVYGKDPTKAASPHIEMAIARYGKETVVPLIQKNATGIIDTVYQRNIENLKRMKLPEEKKSELQGPWEKFLEAYNSGQKVSMGSVIVKKEDEKPVK